MNPFWALRVHESGGETFAKLEKMKLEELTHGEVTIEVHYSGVNYKDALAGAGGGKIMKRYPLNAGIDASGIVLSSTDKRYTAGQKVLINGAGTGENNDGGYAEVLRAHADDLVPLPDGLDLRQAMILGTAGFTAALALHRMEQNGQKPEMGPILVTGASGGVGSFAVQIFSQRGYEVHAVSGKHEAIKYLKALGAHQVITPDDLDLGLRPLEKARYGGAVDNVGGKMLSKVMAHVNLWGNVACIGLAESPELHTTVMPLILRGVSLLGASSNNTPNDLRQTLWKKLAKEWRPKNLEQIVTRTVELTDLMQAFDDLLHRKIHGRILVKIRKGE